MMFRTPWLRFSLGILTNLSMTARSPNFTVCPTFSNSYWPIVRADSRAARTMRPSSTKGCRSSMKRVSKDRQSWRKQYSSFGTEEDASRATVGLSLMRKLQIHMKLPAASAARNKSRTQCHQAKWRFLQLLRMATPSASCQVRRRIHFKTLRQLLQHLRLTA